MTGLERAPVICRAGQQKYSRWLCWALRRGEVNGYKGKRRKEKKSLPHTPARQGLGALLGTFLRPLTLSILGCSRVPTGYLKKLKRRPSDGHSTREGEKKTQRKKNEKSLCNPTSKLEKSPKSTNSNQPLPRRPSNWRPPPRFRHFDNRSLLDPAHNTFIFPFNPRFHKPHRGLPEVQEVVIVK